jgi:hypothetical protein
LRPAEANQKYGRENFSTNPEGASNEAPVP